MFGTLIAVASISKPRISREVSVLLNRRLRRDATRVIYEILSVATTGASKTSVIFKVNLSHKLVERYSVFLLKKGLLKMESEGAGTRYLLTERGERLLGLLREVERELDDFYATSLSTEMIARGQSSRAHPSFGSERGHVPIEIQRALSS